MFSLLGFIRYINLKRKERLARKRYRQLLKSQNELVDNGDVKKALKKANWLRKKFKKAFWVLLLLVLVDVIAITLIVNIWNNSFNRTLNVMGGLVTVMDVEEATNNEVTEEQSWSWDMINPDGEIRGRSGIYPKDPILKQLAKFLDLSDKVAENINKETGVSLANGNTVVGITLRETGGKVINELISRTDIDIYKELMYEEPACCKGGNCKYKQLGIPHFVGSVYNSGVEKFDPANQRVNVSREDYNKAGGDHAMGYFQFENISIESKLVKVFPNGDYENKIYNNATDRYNKDSKLGFIRPNVFYLPDIMSNVVYHNVEGFNNSYGYGKTWEIVKGKDWYNKLTEREKQYCWTVLKDMSYQSGEGVDVEDIESYIGLMELIYALKEEGHIKEMGEVIYFLDGYSKGNTGIEGVIGRSFNRDSYKVSRPNDNHFVKAWNMIMNDNGLGDKVTQAGVRLRGIFRNYRGNDEFTIQPKYIDLVSRSACYVSLGEVIYKEMRKVIENAEKEAGEIGLGNERGRIEGISASNFYESPGVGAGVWSSGGNLLTSKQIYDLIVSQRSHLRGLDLHFGKYVGLNNEIEKRLFNYMERSKFKVPYFSQISSLRESWKGLRVGGLVDFQSEGCAIYMWAHVASALQQRLINPAEMIVVGEYFGCYQNGLFSWNEASHNLFFNSFGYKVKFFSKADCLRDETWDYLDNCLDRNIPSGMRCDRGFTRSGSHFFCIDERVIGNNGESLYRLSQTNYTIEMNKLYSRQELYNIMHGGYRPALYVVDKL